MTTIAPLRRKRCDTGRVSRSRRRDAAKSAVLCVGYGTSLGVFTLGVTAQFGVGAGIGCAALGMVSAEPIGQHLSRLAFHPTTPAPRRNGRARHRVRTP